jgi:magnesium-transporting ATPase (P-type)
MGKINWSRVFLGGVVAGIVFIVLGFLAYTLYLGKLYDSAMQALGRAMPAATTGFYILMIVFSLVSGILAVWLYAAIRPRFGAGARTAVIAGLFFWIVGSLLPAISLGFMGLFSGNLLTVDSITSLVISVVAVLLGAWVYREQAQ